MSAAHASTTAQPTPSRGPRVFGRTLLPILVTAGVFAFAVLPTLAQGNSWVKGILGEELISSKCRSGPQTAKGDCTVNDMLLILVRVTQLILGVMGSAALFMFTYGGYVLLTSAGRAERVSTGKSILVNAVLGIAVILLSWTIVNLILVAFSVGRSGLSEPGKIFANQWTKGP